MYKGRQVQRRGPMGCHVEQTCVTEPAGSSTDAVVCSVGTTTAVTDGQWLNDLQRAYVDDEWCKAIIDSGGTPVYTVQKVDDQGVRLPRSTARLYLRSTQPRCLCYERHTMLLPQGHRGAMATHHRLARQLLLAEDVRGDRYLLQECPVCQQCKNVTVATSWTATATTRA